ncbi:MAG: hypothetical protein ABWK00_03435 [Desulfurococcaceae archaeon]
MSHVEWRRRLRGAEAELLRALGEFLIARGTAWPRGVPSAGEARVSASLEGAFIFPVVEPTLVLKRWSPMVKLSLAVGGARAALSVVWVDLMGASVLYHEGVGRVLDSVAALEVLNPGLLGALRRGEIAGRGDPSQLEALLRAAERVAEGYRDAAAMPTVGPLNLLCVEAWRMAGTDRVLVSAAGEGGLPAGRPLYAVVIESDRGRVDLKVELRDASGNLVKLASSHAELSRELAERVALMLGAASEVLRRRGEALRRGIAEFAVLAR